MPAPGILRITRLWPAAAAAAGALIAAGPVLAAPPRVGLLVTHDRIATQGSALFPQYVPAVAFLVNRGGPLDVAVRRTPGTDSWSALQTVDGVAAPEAARADGHARRPPRGAPGGGRRLSRRGRAAPRRPGPRPEHLPGGLLGPPVRARRAARPGHRLRRADRPEPHRRGRPAAGAVHGPAADAAGDRGLARDAPPRPRGHAAPARAEGRIPSQAAVAGRIRNRTVYRPGRRPTPAMGLRSIGTP